MRILPAVLPLSGTGLLRLLDSPQQPTFVSVWRTRSSRPNSSRVARCRGGACPARSGLTYLRDGTLGSPKQPPLVSLVAPPSDEDPIWHYLQLCGVMIRGALWCRFSSADVGGSLDPCLFLSARAKSGRGNKKTIGSVRMEMGIVQRRLTRRPHLHLTKHPESPN